MAEQQFSTFFVKGYITEFITYDQIKLLKSFGMNRAYCFMLVFTHFLFEAYKHDVTAQVIPVTVYPNTFRRKLIDFAVKITSRAGILY